MAEVAETQGAVESLEDLFARFTDASGKLEQRYESLLNETNELRLKLQKKDQEIKRAERLAVLGETAAAIAHEIRNPLGSIRLFMSLIRADLAEGSTSVEYLNEMEKSMTRLDGVIGNILHFSKEDTLRYGPVNIHSLIQEQLSTQTITGAFGPTQSELCLEANPFILASIDGIRQVISNVLRNALQANGHAGGMLRVQTTDIAEAIEIAIEDSGGGIEESILPSIFEPFASSKAEGTGLGLAIVKRIVSQHCGQIIAENGDCGAKFIIRLPRKPRQGGYKK